MSPRAEGGLARTGVYTHLAHVEGPVRTPTHSIQSRVHGSQRHHGWSGCLQVELYKLPRTVLLGTVHVQLQLAGAGGGGGQSGESFIQPCASPVYPKANPCPAHTVFFLS